MLKAAYPSVKQRVLVDAIGERPNPRGNVFGAKRGRKQRAVRRLHIRHGNGRGGRGESPERRHIVDAQILRRWRIRSQNNVVLSLVYQKLASAYFKAGKSDKALEALASLAKIKNGIFRDSALFMEAKHYEGAGDKAKAEERYKTLAGEYPNSPWTPEATAKTAQRAKEEQAARERAAIALQQARQSTGPKGLEDAGAKERARERAAKALLEARQLTGPKGLVEGQ